MRKKNNFDIRKYLFLIITGGGLVLIWAINLIFFLDNPGFVGVALHPYLLLVVIVASLYGFSRAMLASAIVAASYGVCLLCKLLLEVEAMSRIFQFSFFGPFISFLVIGALVGIMTERHKKSIQSAEKELGESYASIENLQHELKMLQEKNSVMKKKCVSERELVTMLYNIAKKLSTLNLREMQEAILDVIVEFADAQKAALYMKQADKLILCARRGYPSSEEPSPPQTLLKMAIEEKRVLSIKEIAGDGKRVQNPVFILAPLSVGTEGEVAGVIWMEEIPFLRYTPLTIRLVTLLADWASLSLANIFAFEALKKKTEERNQKLHLHRIFDSLTQKYNGVFEYGISQTDIEKELGQKLSAR
jgi:hypothetical protein